MLCIASQLAAQTTIVVAPGGSDDAAGTAVAPFATLQRAQTEVRRIKADGLPAGGVRVLLRGGAYELTEPLALGPEDSGSAEAPIAWAAWPGERPVVSGGRHIEGLTRNPEGSWATTIPAARNHGWVFRQLFINGRRYQPARSPNEGQYLTASGVALEDGTIARDRFVFRPGDLQPWPNLSDVEVMLYFSWNDAHFPLKSVDPQTRVVELGGPAVWSIPKPGMTTAPYLVFNHPGACDAPGEWQLDRTTGELRVIPFADENLGDAEVIAPVHERLIVAQGSPNDGRFVEHLRFEGISFQHAAWVLPPEVSLPPRRPARWARRSNSTPRAISPSAAARSHMSAATVSGSGWTVPTTSSSAVISTISAPVA